MSLYFLVIFFTIIGPLSLSFDKKVAFYKKFKFVFVAVFIVSIPFLVWDSYFTSKLIWGFNEKYISKIYIGNLPLEECLFFIFVPFSCVFIHEVLKVYFPNYEGKKVAHFFAFAFTFSGLLFGIAHLENWYTSTSCIIASFLTIKIYFINRTFWYGKFVLTFLTALIPFLIVNGILTGSITDEPIVWYSSNHIIGFRIFTIPLEDLYYNYCLLLPIIWIYEKFSTLKQ
jgi:lycopene cyclase domain-containing protein